ncbi:hypothetical protein [Sphingobium aromaticiconvertens]|uniref:hypothetical protein n=1 Tax=Sphingobium aromaticiconvertens TaxID=365341 RepID=UPI003018DC87
MSADTKGRETVGDPHSRVMDMANERIWIISHMGKREKVTLFEARLIELTSDKCRRLLCQDFIDLVLMAARKGSRAFNADISEIDVTALETEVMLEYGVKRAF